MVRITEQLIRKKSEHNEGIISTLEELSLHQEDIEKIEHINNWCKDLQILYLQANLISKLENLNKLKKLVYLNLAINNIEVIENLERCESLEKLDLTLNFIGNIESVCSLKHNIRLERLYLTGNPCCDYADYRNYVVATLPQIQSLDNVEITRSEKIKALQILSKTKHSVKEAQMQYFKFRAHQRERLSVPNKDDDETFWQKKSENAPEIRVEMALRSRRSKDLKNVEVVEKKTVRLYSKNGRPLNVNQAKVDFKFHDDDPNDLVLDIAVYKYLDTSLIEVDVQPILVKVIIKGKAFQFVLPEEVCTDKSVAQRSQTSGHLVVRMPRVNCKSNTKIKSIDIKSTTETRENGNVKIQKHKYLEVGQTESVDYRKIVDNNEHKTLDFVNPEIPPLEYG